MLWLMELNRFWRHFAQWWYQVVALYDQPSLALCPVSHSAVYEPDVPLYNIIDLPIPNSKAHGSYLEYTKIVYMLYWF